MALEAKISVSDKAKAIVENVRKRGLKDVLDPQVWKTAKQWADIEKQGLLLPPGEIVSFAQQLVYRMVMCQSCVDAGKCPHCTCAMPHKMCCAAGKCPLERWQEMMEAGDWEKFFENFQFIIIEKNQSTE